MQVLGMHIKFDGDDDRARVVEGLGTPLLTIGDDISISAENAESAEAFAAAAVAFARAFREAYGAASGFDLKVGDIVEIMTSRERGTIEGIDYRDGTAYISVAVPTGIDHATRCVVCFAGDLTVPSPRPGDRVRVADGRTGVVMAGNPRLGYRIRFTEDENVEREDLQMVAP